MEEKPQEGGRIVIRDKKFLDDLKISAIREGYKRMEDYIKFLHGHRKIYKNGLGKKQD